MLHFDMLNSICKVLAHMDKSCCRISEFMVLYIFMVPVLYYYYACFHTDGVAPELSEDCNKCANIGDISLTVCFRKHE